MDQSNPVISIITPTYNRSYELDHLIESINIQTLDHKYFEMIISDDGSTDDTDDKIKKWSRIVDFNLKYISQKISVPAPLETMELKILLVNSLFLLIQIVKPTKIG